jgi:hypothetical protein
MASFADAPPATARNEIAAGLIARMTSDASPLCMIAPKQKAQNRDCYIPTYGLRQSLVAILLQCNIEGMPA